MGKTITVSYNQQSLSKLSADLDSFANLLKKNGEKVADDLAEIGLKEMISNYNGSEYESGDTMDFGKTGDNKEKKIFMKGTQAIYTEFGTGTRGGMNPHPDKNKFNLNAYNSGPTIRTASKKVSEISGIPEGTLYWTFKDTSGKIHYTQGIPAQKIVYNADKKIKESLPEVLKKVISETIKEAFK